jgi:hypothetical protein
MRMQLILGDKCTFPNSFVATRRSESYSQTLLDAVAYTKAAYNTPDCEYFTKALV